MIPGPDGRVALYYAPAEDDPLWAAAASWLGRDAASGAVCVQPPVPQIGAVTAAPRRYGFHLTLKAPMRLRDGATWSAVRAAAAEIAAGIPAFPLPQMQVANLGGFLALREITPSVPMQAFADACVAGADHLRAPPDRDELARRRGGVLTPGQAANVVRWGYPYVFAAWFFHMTLTRHLTDEERLRFQPEAEAHFAAALLQPRLVSDLSLFVQPAKDAPFILAERIKLRG